MLVNPYLVFFCCFIIRIFFLIRARSGFKIAKDTFSVRVAIFIKYWSAFFYLKYCALFNISPTITLYFCTKDFHSYLAARGLQILKKKFRIKVNVVILPIEFNSYGCGSETFVKWSVKDGGNIAKLYHSMLKVKPCEKIPSNEQFKAFQLQALRNTDLDHIVKSAEALWQGSFGVSSGGDLKAKKAPITVCFSGTMRLAFLDYWGIDRIGYLEQKLISFEKKSDRADFTLTRSLDLIPLPDFRPKHPIKLYWSFRSPYSAICLDRFFQLTDFYNLRVEFCPILPLAIREGANTVRLAKQVYIITDVLREAKTAEAPFGTYMCDPLSFIEIGFDLFVFAQNLGQERQLFLTWARCVWNEGYILSNDYYLKKFVDKLGWDWQEVQLHLKETSGEWRADAEKNCSDLMDLGLWGVPSFMYGDDVFWGNDRIWLLEKTILRNCT